MSNKLGNVNIGLISYFQFLIEIICVVTVPYRGSIIFVGPPPAPPDDRTDGPMPNQGVVSLQQTTPINYPRGCDTMMQNQIQHQPHKPGLLEIFLGTFTRS